MVNIDVDQILLIKAKRVTVSSPGRERFVAKHQVLVSCLTSHGGLWCLLRCLLIMVVARIFPRLQTVTTHL